MNIQTQRLFEGTLKRVRRYSNPCALGHVIETPVQVERLARIEPFVPSVVQLTSYATNQGHKLRTTRGDNGPRVTFDDMALRDLMRAYPTDQMYPLVLDYREYEKLLSVYVGTPRTEECVVPDNYVLQLGEEWVDED